MKYFVLILLFCVSSCYVYKPYEPVDENDFLSFREQIQPEKNYKITTAENTFKIEAAQWQGDSLLAFRKANKNDTIILAENQIQNVEHRVFSRGGSDALTFGTYGIIGVIIYFLVK